VVIDHAKHTISGNTATTGNGAECTLTYTLTLDRSTISGNTATGNGAEPGSN